jgi:hypothetical protein
MISAASKEFKNPPIEECDTNRSAIIMVHVFTINVSNPKERRLNGRVIRSKSGFIIIFVRNMTTPITSRAFRSFISMVLIKEDKRYKVTTIERNFSNRFFICSSSTYKIWSQILAL